MIVFVICALESADATPEMLSLSNSILLIDAVKAQVKISHPDSADLAYLYGTILTDGKDAFAEDPTANLCIFADRQVRATFIVYLITHLFICLKHVGDSINTNKSARSV